MKKQIFYLNPQVDPYLIEVPYPIIWLDWINDDCLATPDLICLVEQFYFSN